MKGLEPSTPGTTIQCSNQLSYTHRKQNILARQKGFEPLTYGLEGRCSIHLSYWRQKEPRVLSAERRKCHVSKPSALRAHNSGLLDGRGEKIRTSDPLRPRQVRYQSALRPVKNEQRSFYTGDPLNQP